MVVRGIVHGGERYCTWWWYTASSKLLMKPLPTGLPFQEILLVTWLGTVVRLASSEFSLFFKG